MSPQAAQPNDPIARLDTTTTTTMITTMTTIMTTTIAR